MTDSAKKTLIIVLSLIALGALLVFAFRSQPEEASEVSEEVSPSPTSAVAGLPGEMEQASPLPTSAPETADDLEILTSQVWSWVRTQMNDGSVVTPNNPGVFTATFQEDGTISLGTDCNGMSGMFSLPAVGQIAFAPMATTLMFCEDSQESEFSRMITDSTGYMFQDGKLVLLIKFDSGSVMFE